MTARPLATPVLAGAIMSLALMVTAGGAEASLLNSPLPSNAYVQKDGLDWAWANAVSADFITRYPNAQIDFSYQGTQGWRLPTLAELQFAPEATDFLFPGADVPFNGVDPVSGAIFLATNAAYTGDGACATPYFNNVFTNCDWEEGGGQPLGQWATPDSKTTFEQLAVRTSQIPEPSALALISASLLSLFGLGLMRRRTTAGQK
jgi:hypothetical protein